MPPKNPADSWELANQLEVIVLIGGVLPLLGSMIRSIASGIELVSFQRNPCENKDCII
jgi:hypothetical protein